MPWRCLKTRGRTPFGAILPSQSNSDMVTSSGTTYATLRRLSLRLNRKGALLTREECDACQRHSRTTHDPDAALIARALWSAWRATATPDTRN